MSKEHIGNCHICGKYGKLTFEHIPPKCAFNNKIARVYTGDSLIKLISEKNRLPWDNTGLRYKSLQKGMGEYSLCSDCNNIMGALYGEEYAKWFYSVLEMIRSNKDAYLNAGSANFKFKDVYPGRFIRQILSIVCSTYPGFVYDYPFVKDLILNKDYAYTGKVDFKIYMYLLKNPYNGYTRKTALILKEFSIKIVDQIDLYPFGFIICMSAHEEQELNITNFINYGYNDKAEIEFNINVHEKNNILPTDFRSKTDIINFSKQ